jgi:hypothetical protein
VLGRNTVLDADLFSTCLAVENLWLAARCEGLGVGWVSILEPVELARLLELPANVVPLAYLCLGYVSEFRVGPELEQVGWRSRLPLTEVIHANRWGNGGRLKGRGAGEQLWKREAFGLARPLLLFSYTKLLQRLDQGPPSRPNSQRAKTVSAVSPGAGQLRSSQVIASSAPLGPSTSLCARVSRTVTSSGAASSDNNG